MTEETVDGFETEIEGYNVTNTPKVEEEHNPTTLTLNKTDKNTGNGIAGVTFTLTEEGATGEAKTYTYTTGADGTVTITFDDDAASQNPKKGTYTLTETVPTGYQTPDPASYTIVVDQEIKVEEVEENGKLSFFKKIFNMIFGSATADLFDDGTNTLTIPNTPVTKDITATKVWNDNSNKDNTRPANVVFALFKTPEGGQKAPVLGADGKQIKATLTGEGNEWTTTFTNLPEYEDGKKLTYTVEEQGLNDNGELPGLNDAVYTVKHDGLKVTNSTQTEPVKTAWIGTDTKIVNGQVVEAGSTLTYKVEYVNTTGGKLDKVTITDKIPGNTTFVSASEPGTESNGTVTWIFENVEDGQKIEVSVTVKVNEAASGELLKNKAIVDDGVHEPFSSNETSNPTSVKLSFPVEKIVSFPETLEGPTDWKYTINVAVATGSPEGTPVADSMTGEVTKAQPTTTFGDFTYTEPGTYTYTVTETGEIAGVTNEKDEDGKPAVKTVTVTVSQDPDTKVLTASATATDKEPLTFTNTYSVDPITANFPVKKIMSVPEDLDGPADWTYKINVTGKPEAKAMEGTVTKAADTTSFGPFEFTEPGTYTYTVSETKVGEIPGVTDDNQAAGKTVTIVVADDHEGHLVVTSIKDADKNDVNEKAPLTFTNKYDADPVTVDTSVHFKKTVASMPPGAKSVTFNFTLTEVLEEGATGEPKTYTGTVQATEAGDYKIDFGKITYNKVGTYKYTLTEVLDGLDGGWVVTGSPVEVTVEVKDGKEGELVATVSDKTITNTFDTVNVPGEKTWNDKEYLEYDGYERPESITVNLLADGKKIKSVEVKPDKDGNWTFEFKDLPKYKDHGTEIVYSVEEEPVAGFEASAGELTYDIVNTPKRDEDDKLNPTTITLKKVDYLTTPDEEGFKPGLKGAEFTLTSKLLDEPVVYTTNEDGIVEITFDVNGEYTLTETKAPEGYQLPADPALSYTINVEKNFIKKVQLNENKSVWTWIYDLIAGITKDYDPETQTLTVSDTPAYTSITVEKIWDDASNQDGFRADTKATVQLYKTVGETKTAVGDPVSVVVTDADKWTKTFDNLPAYEDGKQITYSVEETLEGEKYEKEITDPVTADPEKENSGKITVTNSYTPQETKVEVEKTWADADDQDGLRETAEAKVQLYKTVDGTETAVGDPVTVGTKDNTWKHEWTKLPVYEAGKKITYSVKETFKKDSGYEESISSALEAQETETGKITVTNTHKPELTDISATKKWNDEEYQGIKGYERPASITLNLKDKDNADKVVATANVKGDETGDWTYTFKDLPKYKDHGKEIVYVVEEEAAAGFTGAAEGDLVINNTPNRDEDEVLNPIALTICKVDVDGNEIGLPGAVFTLSGEELEGDVEYTTGEDGTVKITFEKDGSYTLTETEAPEGYEIPEDATYTIEVEKKIAEVKLDKEKNAWTWVYDLAFDEESTVFDTDSMRLTVEDPSEKMSITAIKEWDDKDDKDGVRPEKITLTLTGWVGDEEVYSDMIKIGEDDDWTYTWEDLNKYRDGEEITYEVSEKKVDKYETEIGEMEETDEGYEVTITNTHTPKKAPKTGDTTQIVPYAVMFAAALAALILLLMRRRREN